MESAENREQSPKANQQQENSDVQPLSKIETIKLLNESIDQLESTIRDISDNSAEKLPSSDSINTLLNTTQELAGSVAPAPTPEVIVRENPVVEKLPTSEAAIKPGETKSITATEIKITPPASSPEKKAPAKRSVKNVVKPKKKSNKALITIGAIIGAIAITVVAWFYFPQIKAAVSPANEPIITTIDPEISSNSETINIPVTNSNDTDIVIEDESPDSNISITEAEPEITAPVVIPQDLNSPGRAKNLKIETIEPELTFTPEQTLIAALQTKLAEFTANYDSDLFTNIKVDLPQTSLLVEVTDNWYELNQSRQDRLGNEILKRSRQLNFSNLQLLDSTGKLVARNPVVGDRIIIVQSTKEN